MKELIRKFLGVLEKVRSLRIPDSYSELGQCEVILCCGDADRTDSFRGLAYSKFIDSLAERLEHEGVLVRQFSWPYSQIAAGRAWGAPRTANRYVFFHESISKILALIGLVGYGDARAVELYIKILKDTGARCLIGIGLPQSAIKAAAEVGVRSIELLHGYGYSAVPWGWDADSVALPNRIFVFDEVSKNTFERLGSRGVQVNLMPNYWYQKFCANEQVEVSVDWAPSFGWMPKSGKVILVSLQWAYDGDHGEYHYFSGLLKNGLFPEQLLDVIRKNHKDTYWLFRLHPVQLRSLKYRHHRRLLAKLVEVNKNCDWVHGSVVPLPSLLKRCHGHITMSSMTAYDAAFMGVPTLLLCPTLRAGGANATMFSDLRADGYAELGEITAKSIDDWVKKANKRPPLRSVDLGGRVKLREMIFS